MPIIQHHTNSSKPTPPTPLFFNELKKCMALELGSDKYKSCIMALSLDNDITPSSFTDIENSSLSIDQKNILGRKELIKHSRCKYMSIYLQKNTPKETFNEYKACMELTSVLNNTVEADIIKNCDNYITTVMSLTQLE